MIIGVGAALDFTADATTTSLMEGVDKVGKAVIGVAEEQQVEGDNSIFSIKNPGKLYLDSGITQVILLIEVRR